MEITPEMIAQTYKAALDSVWVIGELTAKETLAADEVDTIRRNKEHLEIVVAKDFWTTEDLTPLKDAIAK